MGIHSLDGKTALVTGSAVRIGKEIALSLAERGVNIIIHYNKSRAQAEELSFELTKMGVRSWLLSSDFTQQNNLDNLIEKSLKLSGNLDFLINNASIFPKSNLNDLTLEDLFTNIKVNAWAPFSLSRSYAKQIKQGCIINILDQRITSFDWSHTGYILSKHILTELTRITATAYAPSIRVNGIAPGLILPPVGKPESFLESLTDTLPLKRHGNPRDIGETVVFLASNDFITGEVVFVDGGRHLKEG